MNNFINEKYYKLSITKDFLKFIRIWGNKFTFSHCRCGFLNFVCSCFVYLYLCFLHIVQRILILQISILWPFGWLYLCDSIKLKISYDKIIQPKMMVRLLVAFVLTRFHIGCMKQIANVLENFDVKTIVRIFLFVLKFLNTPYSLLFSSMNGIK